MNVNKRLRDDGFLVLENVISEDKADYFKSLLETSYAKYSKYYADLGPEKGLSNKTKVVYNMYNKHIDFFEIFSIKYYNSI